MDTIKNNFLGHIMNLYTFYTIAATADFVIIVLIIPTQADCEYQCCLNNVNDLRENPYSEFISILYLKGLPK